MMTQTEQHDRETLRNVLSDYLDAYRIEMPISIQEVIIRKFFKPDDDFRPICALQYGDYILCVPQKALTRLRGFLYWDAQQGRIRKVLTNSSE